MRLTAAALLIAASLGPHAHAQRAAALPELLQQALSAPAGSGVYAFDFFDIREGESGGTVRGRIDPSRPKGQRVTIHEATGDDTDIRKLTERYERNASGEIWCDQMAGGVDGPVTDRGMYAGGRVFSFTPKARADASGDEKRLYKQMVAEVTVDPQTGQIRAFRAHLPKSWKPNVLARLNQVEMTGQCAQGPNGRSYQIESVMTLRGSAVGSDFGQTVRRTITNLTPAGAPG